MPGTELSLDLDIHFDYCDDAWPDVLARLQSRQNERQSGYSDCRHPAKTLRYKICSNKTRQYGYQCDYCGDMVGVLIPKPPLTERLELPEWDASLRAAYYRKRPNYFELCREEQTNLFWRFHEGYMNTKKWQGIRSKVLERSEGMCEGCLVRLADNVHHKTYKHLGDELLFELVAVCRKCHDRVHRQVQGIDP